MMTTKVMVIIIIIIAKQQQQHMSNTWYLTTSCHGSKRSTNTNSPTLSTPFSVFHSVLLQVRKPTVSSVSFKP